MNLKYFVALILEAYLSNDCLLYYHGKMFSISARGNA
jgi:hypothetical protein